MDIIVTMLTVFFYDYIIYIYLNIQFWYFLVKYFSFITFDDLKSKYVVQ